MGKIIDKLLSDIKNMQECGCAGVGVTTGSFAPAVTNTVYPRPKKFREKVLDKILDELAQEQDDGEDESEKYYTTSSDWSNANWEQYNKNAKEIEDRKNAPKIEFVKKYRERNNKKAKELDAVLEQYLNDDSVSLLKLKYWKDKVSRQLIRAIVDCKNYEKMSAEEFNKMEKHPMKPISTKLEYWQVRKIDPYEN